MAPILLSLAFPRWQGIMAPSTAFPSYPPSVSYTHLDVYKRQPFPIPSYFRRYRAFDFGYARPFAVLWFGVDSDGPAYLYREWYGAVSYTHLDVYKRQPQVFVFNEEGKAESFVDPIPAGAEESAQSAANSCPVSVIEIQ